MTFQAAAITGKIGMDQSPTIQAFKAVENGAKEMKGKVESTLGDTGKEGAKGFLKGLNSELGKRSLAAQFTKLAMGGGAIAGVSMIEGAVKNFTGELVNLKNEYASGAISAGTMTERVLAQLPVFGRAWQIGRDIREMITGENAALEKQNKLREENTKKLEESLEAMQKIGKQREAVKLDFMGTKKELDQQGQLLGMPDDQARRLLEQQFKTSGAIQAWEDKAAAAKAQYDAAKSKFWGSMTSGNMAEMEAAEGFWQLTVREAQFAEDAITKADKAMQNYIRHGDEWADLHKQLKGFELGPPANPQAPDRPAAVNPLEEFMHRLSRIEQPHWMQLPDQRTQSEEAFGSGKFVRTGDLPSPYVNAAMNTEKNTKETADAVKQLRDRFSSGPMPNGQTIDVVTMP